MYPSLPFASRGIRQGGTGQETDTNYWRYVDDTYLHHDGSTSRRGQDLRAQPRSARPGQNPRSLSPPAVNGPASNIVSS